jgi:uncharacterized alpha-E superfamily protein
MLRKIAGFSGLVHENMHRTASWQFLTIGRSLERAAMMTDLLAAVTGPEAPEGGLDLAIEIGDSIMTHRQRYAVITTRDTVLDLLVLDESNPRSVRFHLDVIRKRLADLTEADGTGQLSDIDRQALAVQSSVAIQSVARLDATALRKAHADILALSPALGAAFLQ